MLGAAVAVTIGFNFGVPKLEAPVQKHGRVRSTLRWGCHLRRIIKIVLGVSINIIIVVKVESVMNVCVAI